MSNITRRVLCVLNKSIRGSFSIPVSSPSSSSNGMTRLIIDAPPGSLSQSFIAGSSALATTLPSIWSLKVPSRSGDFLCLAAGYSVSFLSELGLLWSREELLSKSDQSGVNLVCSVNAFPPSFIFRARTPLLFPSPGGSLSLSFLRGASLLDLRDRSLRLLVRPNRFTPTFSSL